MASRRKVSYEFNPFDLVGIDPSTVSDKEAALRDVADYVREQTLEYMGNQRSPVSGHGNFPRLSREYKDRKEASGRPGVPDLEFFGDLKDAVDTVVRGNRVTSRVSGPESGKADGHNNHSGDSPLPLRRFIPKGDDGETYKKPILDGIRRILRTYQE